MQSSIHQQLETSLFHYGHFLQAFIRYLIHFIQLPLIPVMHRNEADVQLVALLGLIEKIHMHLFTRNLLLSPKNRSYLPVTNDIPIELDLLELKSVMTFYCFSEESYKQQCLHTLQHIEHYYTDHSASITIIQADLPAPWKPGGTAI